MQQRAAGANISLQTPSWRYFTQEQKYQPHGSARGKIEGEQQRFVFIRPVRLQAAQKNTPGDVLNLERVAAPIAAHEFMMKIIYAYGQL